MTGRVILVCGGRDFEDFDLLCNSLLDLNDSEKIGAVVHGNARGADQLAGKFAQQLGICEIRVPANWTFYGPTAGPARNTWMLQFLRVDQVVAFPGGKGTADMIAKARAAGIPVHEVTG